MINRPQEIKRLKRLLRCNPIVGISDLKLSHLDIIHAGDQTFPLSRQVRALSFSRLLKDLKASFVKNESVRYGRAKTQ